MPPVRARVQVALSAVLALAVAPLGGCQGGTEAPTGPAAGSVAHAPVAAGSGSSGAASGASAPDPGALSSSADDGSAADDVHGATPYDRDIDRICNVERLSGALDVPEGGRQLAIAQWLPGALETEDAHTFLVKFGRLGPAEKAAALDAEAKKAGLAECPLARSWHK